MKRALVLLIVVVAASAAADPSSPPRSKHHAAKPAPAPTTSTIVVGTEAPRPRVIIAHPRDARAVVGRPSMDDHLESLPHHLH